MSMHAFPEALWAKMDLPTSHRLEVGEEGVSWFNAAADNEAPDSRSLTPPLPPLRDGEEKLTKGETCGLR